MAVSAAYIAFRNLGHHGFQRVRASDHPLDTLALFSAHMVKVQYNRIRLAAINARMHQQILVHRQALAMSVKPLAFRRQALWHCVAG